MKILYSILSIAILSAIVSCKKYVNVGAPKDQLVNSVVFVNDASATAAITGIYSDMNGFNYQFANVVTTFMCAMAADEFTYASASAPFDEFKNNAVTSGNQYVGTMWTQPYGFIYRANTVIAGVNASTTLSPAVKNQLLGEALFIRAFCYFYLVNFFGDVPLILDTDVLKNTSLPRTAKAEVYASVINDLTEAKKLLVLPYPGNAERIRPNKTAASLLLSRTYLYVGNNALAEQEATEVINTTGYALLKNPDPNNAAHMTKVFLKNSSEAVWQLQSINTSTGRNTWEGNTLLSTGAPFYRLNKGAGSLVEAFGTNDLRKTNWVGEYITTAVPPVTHYFPAKYKVRVGTINAPTEYSMVLRFAEAYLIRAEARAQQNKFSLMKEDLDVIRDRAGLAALPLVADQAAAMAQVEKERRLELFTEWGHRWFDLKRWKSVTGDPTKTRADDVLAPIKTAWKSTAILFPIPSEPMLTNPNMLQNPGYN
ncbi:RagB/SusD family nutrient uptake outer membrane protein [Pedobacter sp. MC2016-24]|uniref:RagB/SusD family nutrient uptake outer membrane protein n=1 Tax=Pedobacter sp. MC2016-24 TaxID=2780090 RepID=UPI001881BEE5|nr:RagB/SusD family nutrient uptake outer membrane protein [Pedobacter sp. MC2016-24]MBE9600333.1 RagB/SusD family nutrient uptake outer membrane protein [Pedobacter sp. MC2016-24]